MSRKTRYRLFTVFATTVIFPAVFQAISMAVGVYRPDVVELASAALVGACAGLYIVASEH